MPRIAWSSRLTDDKHPNSMNEPHRFLKPLWDARLTVRMPGWYSGFVKQPLLRPIISLSSVSLVILCLATALFGQTASKPQLPTYRVTSVAVGNHPLGLTFDGENIWVVNSVDGTVSKLRARYGTLLGTFEVGSYPQYDCFDGANIWVANYEGTVTELRASDGALLGTFPVGNAPTGIAFDGQNIWVANSISNNVTKLRASDGALLGTFPTDYGPYAILTNGTRIWVAGGGSVTELRAGDGSQVGIYPVSDLEPNLRSIVSDGHNIWVGRYDYPGGVSPGQGITALNARKGTVLGSVKVPKGPDGLAFDGTYIWVSEANAGTVSIVDPVTKVNLQDIGVGNYPAGIVFDGTNIWVANQASNTVSRISPE